MNPVLNIPDAHMGRRRIIRFLQQLPDAFQRCLVNAAAIVSDADRKGFLTRGENSNANTVLAILSVLERMDKAVFKHRLHGKLEYLTRQQSIVDIPVHINARKAKLHEGKIAFCKCQFFFQRYDGCTVLDRFLHQIVQKRNTLFDFILYAKFGDRNRFDIFQRIEQKMRVDLMLKNSRLRLLQFGQRLRQRFFKLCTFRYILGDILVDERDLDERFVAALF